LLEPRAGGGQRGKARCLDLLAVPAHVGPSQVVGQDEHDVRTGWRRIGPSRRDQDRGQTGGEQSRECAPAARGPSAFCLGHCRSFGNTKSGETWRGWVVEGGHSAARRAACRVPRGVLRSYGVLLATSRTGGPHSGFFSWASQESQRPSSSSTFSGWLTARSS